MTFFSAPRFTGFFCLYSFPSPSLLLDLSFVAIQSFPTTGWRRLIRCLELQVIFRKRATNFRALLRKMTYKDKASYDSTPPCMRPSLNQKKHIWDQSASTHVCRWKYLNPTDHLFASFTLAKIISPYGVATVSRIDKIVGLFCRIASLL